MTTDRSAPGHTLAEPRLPPLPRSSRLTDPPHHADGSAVESSLEQFSRLDPSDPRRAALRDQVVEAYLPLVRSLARRYRHHDEPFDDLVQVGTIGLIHAVDRYEPERQVALGTYATLTILGEIRRHLRDLTGTVRLPRHLQERHQLLTRVGAELTQRLQRSPTVRELACESGMDVELVLETWEAQRTREMVHLDTTATDDARLGHHFSALSCDDEALEAVLDRESLRPLLKSLTEREKRIIVLRFFRGLSQRQIAAEFGISQMHVSRLLNRTLARLRHEVVVHDDSDRGT